MSSISKLKGKEIEVRTLVKNGASIDDLMFIYDACKETLMTYLDSWGITDVPRSSTLISPRRAIRNRKVEKVEIHGKTYYDITALIIDVGGDVWDGEEISFDSLKKGFVNG